MSMVAVIQSERSTVSIWFWNSRPRTMMGSEPRMISQPRRASGSVRETRPVSDFAHWPMMRTMSRQKKMTTAVSVPIWVMAVKRAPGSSPVPRNWPTMVMWALDDTGRNSVNP